MRTPFVLAAASLADAAVGDRVALADGRDAHLHRVLRRADGDPLELTDGAGHVAEAVLAGDHAVLSTAPVVVPRPTPSVTVVHAMPKGRAMDEVVRTLAELGTAAVVPVVTARTVVRPADSKARSVGDRLRSVAASACEQARSAHMCAVEDPAPWTVTQRHVAADTMRLVAHPAAGVGLGTVLRDREAPQSIVLAIGPEGGFSEAEIVDAEAAGWVAVHAGHTVLRTVHAGPVLTAAVMALTGRYA